jgi:hypothetical protein
MHDALLLFNRTLRCPLAAHVCCSPGALAAADTFDAQPTAAAAAAAAVHASVTPNYYYMYATRYSSTTTYTIKYSGTTTVKVSHHRLRRHTHPSHEPRSMCHTGRCNTDSVSQPATVRQLLM